MSIHVLKLGGGAGIQHAPALANLARRVAGGEAWVLVHGCSDAANRLAEEQGYPAQTLVSPNGHTSRYTDPRTLAIFCQAAASVNFALVGELVSLGAPAVGLIPNERGGGVVRAERKSAIRAIKNGRQVIIRDDYSGKITGIEAAPLQALLAKGQIPVIAPLALGMEGERLNVDGDLVAAEIAKALGAEHLLLLSNVAGLLRDVNEPTSLVSGFRLTEWADYEGLAQGRMKKKLLAAQVAAPSITILADARLPAPLDAALAGGGTHISPS